ncbi:MAG: phosphate acyltransferase PlsX [Planctomycetota bacterium]|jgi:glycerol-3-phosphate acyltransferase PlsX
MRVAIDAMGGDRGPVAVVEGAVAFLAEDPETELVLVGREDVLAPILKSHGLAGHPRVKVKGASEVIAMGEKIASVRQKRDASIMRAVEAVRDGEADALVAVGNTLAAVAASTLRLRVAEGAHRAGIAVPLPSKSGTTVMIDMGANTACKCEHLVDYAVMASIYASEVLGITEPRVGLLNVGEELGKGNELLREAHELIEKAPVRFIGNVEGGDIYRGTCDVVVCDGFVGNAVLKASEGAAEIVAYMLRQELGRSLRRKLGALLARGAFRDVKRRSDYAEFGGAPLLGLNGAVIIGHGKSDARALQNAIRVARDSASHDIVGKIRERLKAMGGGGEPKGRSDTRKRDGSARKTPSAT